MLTHLVLDGVADGPLGVGLEVVGAVARLARAGLIAAPPRRWLAPPRVLSLDGQPVRTGAGRRLEVDGALAGRRAVAGELLVVPGLGAVSERQVTRLLERGDVQRSAALLARAHARGAVVAASCSATFVLAAAGLLEGKRATTVWWLRASFARRFPGVGLELERMVVEDERVVTAGAALAHADLALALVARALGPSVAHLVARYLVLDERTSQARYLVTEHLRSADPVVQALEAFALPRLGRQLSLAELARATATSPRTLARRVRSATGQAPLRFVQRLRVARAVHLLETSRASVEEVAARVGYSDGAAFRRVFRRETGEAPAAHRRRGGARQRR